jgi:hypothetical protein
LIQTLVEKLCPSSVYKFVFVKGLVVLNSVVKPEVAFEVISVYLNKVRGLEGGFGRHEGAFGDNFTNSAVKSTISTTIAETDAPALSNRLGKCETLLNSVDSNNLEVVMQHQVRAAGVFDAEYQMKPFSRRDAGRGDLQLYAICGVTHNGRL